MMLKDLTLTLHVIQLMFELNAERGTTLVMVTHDRAIAAQCNQRVVIEAGRIAS